MSCRRVRTPCWRSARAAMRRSTARNSSLPELFRRSREWRAIPRTIAAADPRVALESRRDRIPDVTEMSRQVDTFEREGLLDGLEGRDREARLALLHKLSED